MSYLLDSKSSKMVLTVSGGVRVLLPLDWVGNDTVMRLDWLAGAVRSKGKGVLNITGFNQPNCVEKTRNSKVESCTVLQVVTVFNCLKFFVI